MLASIEGAGLPEGYAELLRLGVAERGKVLSPEPGSRWPLLVLAVCEAASGGEWRHAAPAAGAVEVFIAALDLLDDLQDEDPNLVVARCGRSQAINVSTGLVMLAQRLLRRLAPPRCPPELALAALRELDDAALLVGGGQYLDLHYEGRTDVSEETALDVASRKSAALVSCACRIGARLGADDGALIDGFGKAGFHAGLAAQLANDLGDVAPRHPEKSDIRRGKRTFPLVVATKLGLPDDWVGRAERAGRDPRDVLAESGALHYTWVIADLHKRQASEILDNLTTAAPVDAVRTLLKLD